MSIAGSRSRLGFHAATVLLAVATAALVALAPAPGASAQELRFGIEFQVNTYTESGQLGYPVAVATDAGGGFVVAWESELQDGSQGGVFARRFSNAGVALAAEFQVNTVTALRQGYPAATVAANGTFVVAWQSAESDGNDRGILARRFSSAGVALTSELQVNSFTAGPQSQPAIAANTGGDFLIAWSSADQDGDSFGVFAQRFASTGARLGGEFQVGQFTAGTQRHPRVAATGNGGFVVAWQNQDGSAYGIAVRRFSSAGTPLGAEFQVNTYLTGNQVNASVATSATGPAAGSFVVSWTDESGQDGSSYGIFGRRFSSAGTALGGEFQINAGTTGIQRESAAAMDASGEFVVAWTGTAGPSSAILARRFSSAGAALTDDFMVSTVTGFAYSLQRPAIAAAGGRRFVVSWTSNPHQDGSDDGVFAQRFGALILLDIDGDGSVKALTDGLLVTRYGFGFTGATLTTGAVGPGCTRCDAASIEAYLAAHID